MVAVRRINPEGGPGRLFKELKGEISSLGTRPSGNIVLRETLTATDPATGVSVMIGKLPDGSTGIQEFVNDTTPPGPPTAPVLTPTLGAVSVSWDGKEVGGLSQPRDYARTEIMYRVAGSLSEWTLGGVFYDANTTLVLNLTPSVTYDFRLISYDRNGNASVPSSIVSETAAALVDNSDVNEALEEVREQAQQAVEGSEAAQKAARSAQTAAEDAAQNALDASNMVAGKSKLLFSDSEPTEPGDRVESTLWIDTSGTPAKNTPHRWDGSAWVQITDRTAVDAAAGATKAQEDAERAAEAAERAAEAAGLALESANGKNRTTYSNTAPPTGTVTGAVVGDTWFRTNTAGVVDGQWTYTASGYSAVTVGHEVIASLDAGKISVGVLDAARLGAKSITSDKLIITSSDNIIQEPDFSAGGVSWGATDTVTYVAGAGRGGGNVLRFTGATLSQNALNTQPRLPVDPGSSYSGSMWVKSNAALPAGKVRLMMRCYTSATALTDVEIASNVTALVANTWTEVTGRTTAGYGKVPNNTINVQFYIQVVNTAATNVTDVDYVSAIRKADGKLIVDGSIDGKTITGALIQSVAASNRGAKLSDSQFVFYNNSGIETLRLDGTNSILTGAVVRTAATGARVQIDSTGLSAFDADNTRYMTVTDGKLNMRGNLEATGTPTDGSFPVTATVGTAEFLGGLVTSPGFAFTSDPEHKAYITNPPGLYTTDGSNIKIMSAGSGVAHMGRLASFINVSTDRSVEIHAQTTSFTDGIDTQGRTQFGGIQVGTITRSPVTTVWGGAPPTIQQVDRGIGYVDYGNWPQSVPSNALWGPGMPPWGLQIQNNFVRWVRNDIFELLVHGVYTIDFIMQLNRPVNNRTFVTIESEGGTVFARSTIWGPEDRVTTSTTRHFSAGQQLAARMFHITDGGAQSVVTHMSIMKHAEYGVI